MEFLRLTDGQTGRRAAFLSSRLRAPDAGCVFVATPLICPQPDASNSLRIFSVCPTFFPSLFLSSRSFWPFSRRWYILPLFLSMCSCPASGIDLCLWRVPAQGLKDITFLPQRGSNTLCQFCCCSGLGSHLYAWPPCSTYRVSVFSNL